MTYHFRTLLEVAEGAISEMDRTFTSRELGEVLHESQQYLPPGDRYPKPLRRGHTAGWVLHHLKERGLVVKCGQRKGGSWWQRTTS